MPRPSSYAVFCLKKKITSSTVAAKRRCSGRIGASSKLQRSLITFFFNYTATTEIYTLSLHDALRSVDDVALGVCKTGAEEAGVTEVRTSLSEKKFELWREIKV